MTIPMYAPLALLAIVCLLPNRAWALLGGVDWVKVLILAYCVGFWVIVGLVVGGAL